MLYENKEYKKYYVMLALRSSFLKKLFITVYVI